MRYKLMIFGLEITKMKTSRILPVLNNSEIRNEATNNKNECPKFKNFDFLVPTC